jgi:hypothetical protein
MPDIRQEAVREAVDRALTTMKEIDDQAGVSRYLDIPERTLSQWRYLGRGPRYIKVGNAVRYRKVDVDLWLEQNAVSPDAA